MTNDCNCKKRCESPCGCAEPVFDIEALDTDPTTLRFNVNGKSVWYDFEPVVKAGETCTALNIDAVNRTLNYHGECSDQAISAKELGQVLHLGDLGDVDENSITDNGILNYRRSADCGENCESKAGDGWVSSNPIEVAGTSLDYILGSDAEGRMTSLMPPTDTTTFSYLAWAAQNKAKWVKPTVVSTPPVKDGKVAQLYLDENTGEIVIVRRDA